MVNQCYTIEAIYLYILIIMVNILSRFTVYYITRHHQLTVVSGSWEMVALICSSLDTSSVIYNVLDNNNKLAGTFLSKCNSNHCRSCCLSRFSEHPRARIPLILFASWSSHTANDSIPSLRILWNYTYF